MSSSELLDILIEVWTRGISADDAFDEIYGETFDCNEVDDV